MRYAVIGDIHGNLSALQVVLNDISENGVDCILCVGDIVGYGANPNICVELVREMCDGIVSGNHDCGVAGTMDMSYFNADARDAVAWTSERLSQGDLDFLADLPMTAQLDDIYVVHGSPRYPESFSYIQTLYDARLGFSGFDEKVGFMGHSHVPMIFMNTDPVDYFMVSEFDLPRQRQILINVGSVGQPRDLDSRASYVLFDSEKRRVQLRRLEYDLDAAADAIREAGLPETNAQRLYWGR